MRIESGSRLVHAPCPPSAMSAVSIGQSQERRTESGNHLTTTEWSRAQWLCCACSGRKCSSRLRSDGRPNSFDRIGIRYSGHLVPIIRSRVLESSATLQIENRTGKPNSQPAWANVRTGRCRDGRCQTLQYDQNAHRIIVYTWGSASPACSITPLLWEIVAVCTSPARLRHGKKVAVPANSGK